MAFSHCGLGQVRFVFHAEACGLMCVRTPGTTHHSKQKCPVYLYDDSMSFLPPFRSLAERHAVARRVDVAGSLSFVVDGGGFLCWLSPIGSEGEVERSIPAQRAMRGKVGKGHEYRPVREWYLNLNPSKRWGSQCEMLQVMTDCQLNYCIITVKRASKYPMLYRLLQLCS